MENYEYDIEKKMEEAWNGPHEAVSEDEIQKSWNDLEGTIKSRSRRFKYRLGWAAAIALLMLPALYFLALENSQISVENLAVIDKEVYLPDGSLVLLKQGSEIRYNKSFDKKRGVKLDGQAFFDIEKDSLKEFTVETDYTTTKVLGTSFLVSETPNSQNTEVSLYSGRVLMSLKENQATSWALIPGESFVFEDGQAYVKKFETDLSFSAGNKFSDLNEIKLEKLFEFLEERFGYHFETNEYTKNKLVTLRINKSDSLPQILKLLSLINDTNFEINEVSKKIIISQK